MDPSKFLSGTSGTVAAASFQMDWFPSGFCLLKRFFHFYFRVLVVQERKNGSLTFAFHLSLTLLTHVMFEPHEFSLNHVPLANYRL